MILPFPVMLIWILVNEDHSFLVTSSGYDSGRPAPLAFPFHAFPPLKP